MTCRKSLARRDAGSSIAGFTLMEALIATALMAAILTSLATVTAQWLPNWNRGFARVQRGEMVALGLERVVADLEAAEYVPIGRDANQLFFQGQELSVILVRSSFGPNTRTSLEQVRISEVASEQGPTLVRARGRFVPIVLGVNDRDPLRFPDQVVLLRAPYRVSFAYAGPDRVWVPQWLNTAQLPRAIRVTLRDAAGQILGASTATIVHAEISSECTKNARACAGGQLPPAEGPGANPNAENRQSKNPPARRR